MIKILGCRAKELLQNCYKRKEAFTKLNRQFIKVSFTSYE